MFDTTKLTECPTLQPNIMEFDDPVTYLSRPDIKELGLKYGLLKVVPPREWRPPFVISPDFKFHTRIQKLSDLGILTRSRKFFMESLNRFLKMKRKKQLPWYFMVGETRIYYYDLFSEIHKFDTNVNWKVVNSKFGIDADDNVLKTHFTNDIKYYTDFLQKQDTVNEKISSEPLEKPAAHTRSHLSSPVQLGSPKSDLNSAKSQMSSPKSRMSSQRSFKKDIIQVFSDEESDADSDVESEEESDDNDACVVCGTNDNPEETLLCDGCDDAYHLECVNLTKIPTGSWFCNRCLIGTGDYGFEEELDRKFTIQEFFQAGNNPNDKLEDTEKQFWDLIEDQNDFKVRYGADIHNLIPGQISGFPMTNNPISLQNMYDPNIYHYYAQHPFNMNNLPFAKGSLLNYIDHSISGMTIPWIYVGAKFSTFCWHVEDHYTLSANYCHFGATKKWYGIPANDSLRFENLMRSQAPELFQKQPDLLHQLVTMISPMKLIENGINCYYANQNPNEIVITYPKVYHAGFNSGFNFNEAVNFTTDLWLNYGESSINDYRIIKKENVFNHYKLLENILVNFLEGKETNMSLINTCLSRYKAYVGEIKHFINLMDGEVIDKGGKINYETYKHNQDTKVTDYDQLDQDDDDEQVCEQCKTNIYHVYCKADNFKSIQVNRISISQLLTPESSPQNLSIENFKKDLSGVLRSGQVLNKRIKVEIPRQTRIVCLSCGYKMNNISIVMNVGVPEMDRFISEVDRLLKTT